MQDNTPAFTTNSNTGSNPATAAIKEGSERFAKTAHSGIDAASQAAHPAIDRLASSAHKAVDNAGNAADNAAQALGKAGAKGEELVAAGTSYMREHPLFTIGVAVAAGYVLSRLLATRSH